MTKRLTILTLLIAASVTVAAQTDKPVHLFILSGQSNMQGMNPETGFMPEAKQLFKDEEVVYIKVAKGGQPICRWLEEWLDIAKENGLDENHRRRIHRDGKVEFFCTETYYVRVRRTTRMGSAETIRVVLRTLT